jgi:hypothetical protein
MPHKGKTEFRDNFGRDERFQPVQPEKRYECIPVESLKHTDKYMLPVEPPIAFNAPFDYVEVFLRVNEIIPVQVFQHF